jgi:hypothetical protein
VTQYAAGGDGWHVSLEDMQVGPTDGHRVDLNDGVAGINNRGIRYLAPRALAGSLVHKGFHGIVLLVSMSLTPGFTGVCGHLHWASGGER